MSCEVNGCMPSHQVGLPTVPMFTMIQVPWSPTALQGLTDVEYPFEPHQMADCSLGREPGSKVLRSWFVRCCVSRLAGGNAREQTHSETSSNYLCTNAAQGWMSCCYGSTAASFAGSAAKYARRSSSNSST